MSQGLTLFQTDKGKAFLTGSIFLCLYWALGYDGITFSDDVYYLLAGKNFWQGTMEFNSYHFSTRWGAYVPSGFVGFILGFDPHRISLISLLSYWVSLYLLIKILPKDVNPWILTLWACTQVYFLHFLTKVYPDSLLLMWTVLVPFSASYRHSHPLVASLGVILGLFLGFITKETIVFLAPFPLLLAWLDWKNKTLQPAFYLGLVGFGMALGSIYLGYFWAKFGNPFYRFDSIQDGHYVSEFTYADKSGWVMLKRLTILPIVTFVERAYWIWLVFSLPALLQIRKNPHSTAATFGLALLSLLACFWLMSTNFRFYNPLYLNPRHLIILVPVFSFLIATGWEEWKSNPRLISLMTTLILLGAGISLVQLDWKMAGFQLAFLPLIWYCRMPMKEFGFAVVLLLPALASIRYQQQIKSYPDFINTLTREVKNSENQSIIITNNFIDFSKEVLLPGDVLSQNLLFPIEKLDTLRHLAPAEFRVLIYDYYQHAYPKEQTDVDELEQWLQSATLLSEDCFGKVCIQRYRSMKPE